MREPLTKIEEGRRGAYLSIITYVLYGSIILYLGRDLFIPLAFAALIGFILYPVCAWLEKKRIGRATAIFISLLMLLLLVVVVFFLLVQQFTLFLKEWPTIQLKVHDLVSTITRSAINYYSITEAQQEKWAQELATRLISFLVDGFPSVVTASVYSFVLLIMVPLFAALILYYRHRLVEILFYIFPQERHEDLRSILSLTIGAYYNFIKGMALVYLIVGVLNSAGLLILGVPHAIFFGFVASILTFIPYLGIMVGSLLPLTMAWITFNSVWYPLGVILVFTIVQYLEANVIFPFAVSSRLNMNALATLVAIVAGGIIWGVSGMILFVPFAGIVKLIADRHPKMKLWSLLIGR
ncbi:MAG: AI-2E family transporter [Cyclobacteriaceae bacterium]|nr:AI-2E family transporter [Cyclobacteriaceae bacterium]